MAKKKDYSKFPLDDFKKDFDRAEAARRRFEPDWYLNLCFYVSDQWVFWNRSRLDRPVVTKGRVMLVDNRILGIVQTRLARKTKSKPSFVATPATLDESDVSAAQLAEKVLEADWDDLKLLQKLYQVLLWQEICTIGFWKIYEDDKKGKKDNFIFQGDEPVMGQDQRPLRTAQFEQAGMEMPEGYESRDIYEGDCCVEVLSPFEFYPDPLATCIEDSEHAFEAKVRSPDYVKQRYGVVLEADIDAMPGVAESKLVSPVASGESRQGKAKGVKVYEGWYRPSSKYRDGLRVVWARDQVLHVEEAPVDPMPYVEFSGSIVPGRFWPTSVVSALRGPQSELNKIKSQIRESANRLGNPALLWSKMAGKCTYEGIPGEVLYYDDTTQNSKPDYLRPPEVPVYVQQEVERIESSIQEISGLHEVSKATVPTGVTAASAINLLQEADDTRLGPEVSLMEDSLARAGTKLLKLRALYTDAPRLLRIAGEDGDWDIQEFKGQMLSEETSVTVQSGSMMPRSKAAKQAAMIEVFQLAIQYGVPLQPRNIRRFFKDYEVGGIDRLFADIGPDEAQINWENRQLSLGQPLPINSYDDDDLHIAGHEEYQKSGRYRRIDGPGQQTMQQHIDQHRTRRTQTLDREKQAQAQAATKLAWDEAEREAWVQQQKVEAEIPLEEMKINAQAEHDQQLEAIRQANQNGGKQKEKA